MRKVPGDQDLLPNHFVQLFPLLLGFPGDLLLHLQLQMDPLILADLERLGLLHFLVFLEDQDLLQNLGFLADRLILEDPSDPLLP